jgi:restriction endonuclease S subunit
MNKPKVRFQGYTDDWEHCKLSDVAEFGKGRGYSKGDLKEEGTPIILYGRLYTKYETSIREVDTFVTPKEGSVYSRGGEVIVPASGETAEDISRASTVENAGIILGGDLNVIKPNDDINPAFLALSISNGNLQKELAQKAQGKSIVHIHNEEIKALVVPFPHKEEQDKIVVQFSQLDRLITLHQRKCDETKMLKKYMLQKMFPKDGKCVPEIRFSGYTDDWEQRKLGDVVERITRKNQDLVSTLPLTISAQYGLIDQNEFFDKRVASKDVSGYYLVNKGEFAYNKSTSSDAPWGAIKRLDRYENGVLSTLYIVFGIKDAEKVDSDYLVSYYDTDLWHRGVREIAAEGARNHGLLNIAPADFFETNLMIPQDIEEQKKIGKYFEKINALITLHQRKCEELQNIKKFMLQNMFV